MDLGQRVVDKELIDQHGRRAGKVDDLVLALPDAAEQDRLPEVVGIVTGPLALSPHLPRWYGWFARRFYWLLGLDDPQPDELPWTAVTKIDVDVHVDVDRSTTKGARLAAAVNDRLIRRLPGA